MMPTLVMDDRFAGLFLFSISLLVLSHSSYIPPVFLLFFVSIFPGWPSRCHCLDRLEMVKMAAGSWRWGIRTALPSSLSSYRQQVNERENVFDVSAVQGGHKVERRRNISLLRQPCRERERERRDEKRKTLREVLELQSVVVRFLRLHPRKTFVIGGKTTCLSHFSGRSFLWLNTWESGAAVSAAAADRRWRNVRSTAVQVTVGVRRD